MAVQSAQWKERRFICPYRRTRTRGRSHTTSKQRCRSPLASCFPVAHAIRDWRQVDVIPCVRSRTMSPGQSISHYKITAKLGEGGMGEVWRATDTKLGREVAIKILPEAFAQDAGRLARFTREAQVLASLNHPHIAAIYGVEERALILELVEGATL